jgi:hypothetical protein
MSAPVITRPDLEAWVWANLRDLPGVTSFEYEATEEWPGWVVAHHVQADARAKRKQAARDLAETVRQRVTALAGIPWPDGTVCYVQITEGPFWAPDPDGLPRYTARFEIRVHPPRQQAASLKEPS